MSNIEWTEQTWNPVVGCTKVSPGCKNCYAEKMHARLKAMGAADYQDPFTKVKALEHQLDKPLNRKKPTIYFVNSMSDLFHDGLMATGLFIDRVKYVMGFAPQHIFQVLTKRAENAFSYFDQFCAPDNLWMGVSVEDKKHGLPRIDILRETNVKHRFLSIEPLLEDLGELNLSGIDWVIVGGESGPKARPMNPEWVRSIRDQCIAQNVPFLFKQWGAWGEDGKKRSKSANGRLLDGKKWDEYPTEMVVR